MVVMGYPAGDPADGGAGLSRYQLRGAVSRITPAILTIHDLSPWREKSWQLYTHNADADRVRWRVPWLVRLGRARMILAVSGLHA